MKSTAQYVKDAYYFEPVEDTIFMVQMFTWKLHHIFIQIVVQKTYTARLLRI